LPNEGPREGKEGKEGNDDVPLDCENECDGPERAELKLVQRQRVRSDSDEEPSHHPELEENPEPLKNEETKSES